MAIFLALGVYLGAQKFHINIPIIGAYIPGSVPLEAISQKPYIIVYGRNSCGFTQAMRNDLKAGGIPFNYRSVDTEVYGDELIRRMQAAGMQTESVDLPVVDVNAELMVRPPAATVVEKYRSYPLKAS